MHTESSKGTASSSSSSSTSLHAPTGTILSSGKAARLHRAHINELIYGKDEENNEEFQPAVFVSSREKKGQRKPQSIHDFMDAQDRDQAGLTTTSSFSSSSKAAAYDNMMQTGAENMGRRIVRLLVSKAKKLALDHRNKTRHNVGQAEEREEEEEEEELWREEQPYIVPKQSSHTYGIGFTPYTHLPSKQQESYDSSTHSLQFIRAIQSKIIPMEYKVEVPREFNGFVDVNSLTPSIPPSTSTLLSNYCTLRAAQRAALLADEEEREERRREEEERERERREKERKLPLPPLPIAPTPAPARVSRWGAKPGIAPSTSTSDTIQPQTMMEVKREQTKEEKHAAAFIASKFQESGASSSAPLPGFVGSRSGADTEHMQDIEDKENKISIPLHFQHNTYYEAAMAGQFGRFTREQKEWLPTPLLSKRFGIAIKVPLQHNNRNTRIQSSEAVKDMPSFVQAEEQSTSLSSLLSVEQAQHQQHQQQQQQQEEDKDDIDEELGRVERPAMDLFKAIFEDESEPAPAPLMPVDVDAAFLPMQAQGGHPPHQHAISQPSNTMSDDDDEEVQITGASISVPIKRKSVADYKTHALEFVPARGASTATATSTTAVASKSSSSFASSAASSSSSSTPVPADDDMSFNALGVIPKHKVTYAFAMSGSNAALAHIFTPAPLPPPSSSAPTTSGAGANGKQAGQQESKAKQNKEQIASVSASSSIPSATSTASASSSTNASAMSWPFPRMTMPAQHNNETEERRKGKRERTESVKVEKDKVAPISSSSSSSSHPSASSAVLHELLKLHKLVREEEKKKKSKKESKKKKRKKEKKSKHSKKDKSKKKSRDSSSSSASSSESDQSAK